MRLANVNDISRLSNLRVLQQQDVWEEEYEGVSLFDKTTEYLKRHLNRDLFMLIEEDNNRIIATCGLQIIEYLPQCNDNGRKGYICNVYTVKDYRHKGIQTRLLNKVIDYSKRVNLCKLVLSTDKEEAISIYTKLGFSSNEKTMELDIKP